MTEAFAVWILDAMRVRAAPAVRTHDSERLHARGLLVDYGSSSCDQQSMPAREPSLALQDGVVYHAYSTHARGTGIFNTFYQLLDRAPKGRDEDNIPAGQWWWCRHDEYYLKEDKPR
jgi:predicted dithiol-disulfide oxidoreductase (DUF899 family)